MAEEPEKKDEDKPKDGEVINADALNEGKDAAEQSTTFSIEN